MVHACQLITFKCPLFVPRTNPWPAVGIQRMQFRLVTPTSVVCRISRATGSSAARRPPLGAPRTPAVCLQPAGNPTLSFGASDAFVFERVSIKRAGISNTFAQSVGSDGSRAMTATALELANPSSKWRQVGDMLTDTTN